MLTDGTQQFQSGLRITLLHMAQATDGGLHGEARVTDHAQGVLCILLVDLHGLLVVGGEHHLRAAALTLCGSMGVEGLRREVL